MSFLVIFGIILLILFTASYITKRRFGVLGLALSAGAYISSVWVGDLTPIVAQVGIETVQPPLESIVAAGLIMLPAAILLMSGPAYRGKSQRTMGAILFALLAGMLLLEPLGSALVIAGVGIPIYAFLVEYTIFIVTGLLIVAMLDILGTKTPKLGSKH